MQATNSGFTTIGILYPGEMGAALARLFRSGGYRVVTTCRDRSERTAALARQADCELLDDLESVVARSDVILSLVPPAAAADLARQVAGCTTALPPMYVDANSIAPETSLEIEQMVGDCGIRFVDASIHGLASRLPEQGRMYLSGPGADELARQWQAVLPTRVVSEHVGRASAMKMLLSGISKGLVALFLEIALTAREADLLDAFLENCDDFDPAIMSAVGRMLPTYPRHAERRAQEIGELEAMLRGLGLRPGMIAEARELIAAVAGADLAGLAEAGELSVRDLIEFVALNNPLRLPEPISAGAATS
ncbi:MAG TPA: DUF1932 domain-containing protein [Pirellulales bacterium]